MRVRMETGFRVDGKLRSGRPVYEVSVLLDLSKASRGPLHEACHRHGVLAYREYAGSPLKLAVTVGRNVAHTALRDKKQRDALQGENEDRVMMAKGRINSVLHELGLPIAEEPQRLSPPNL